MNEIKTDIVIIGAGIAGIWLTNVLKSMGFNCILLENYAIGSGQTINSQGMLHSGVKYALQGKVTADTLAIKDAPFLWQQALSKNSQIKLTTNCVLADGQYLWSNGKLSTNIANFFVSKVLQSNVSKIEPNNFPEPFNNNKFNGSLYKLHETILNVPNTLQELCNPIMDNIIKINTIEVQQEATQDIINKLLIDINGEKFLLSAKKYIFTAGEGIKNFLSLFNNSPKMQTRPLHMVAVKAKSLPMLFGHNIGLQQLPSVSVTSHKTSGNSIVWQCGGKIAEDGVNKSSNEQIDIFKSSLKNIFPWLNFDTSEHTWGSLKINRAENLRSDGKKPTHATWFPLNNMIFAWPTKLVLAPMMAEEIVKYLQQELPVEPIKSNNQETNLINLDIIKKLPKPTIASAWWEHI